MQPCVYCGKDVPQQPGKREKRYCNDVCKQLAYRKRKHPTLETIQQKHQDDQQEALLAELEELRTKVTDQARTIEEQASEISILSEKVNVEYRYLEEYDSKKYNFKAWLKKKHLSSALIEKMLANSHFFRTSQETRKHYEYFLQVSLHCTDEEMEDFTRLWKMMLLRP